MANSFANEPHAEPEVLAKERTAFDIEDRHDGITIIISDKRMPFSFAAHQTYAQASDLARKLNEALGR